jgi:hypothetical protein
MIHQNIKGLQEECDRYIDRAISLNIPITDTKNEHSLMVFILQREGRKFEAYSPSREIKSAKVTLDDCYHLDELLQDLYSKCLDNINNSKRYKVKEC